MLCSSCATLSILYSKRTCFRCKIEIYSNLYVICDTCATKDQVCNICLKKNNASQNIKKQSGGCRCGSK